MPARPSPRAEDRRESGFQPPSVGGAGLPRCSQRPSRAGLQNPDAHAFAERGPRAFLNRFGSGAILDEVQRCPHLLSWLRGQVNEREKTGDFVLTGSTLFDLIAGITQSLTGNVGRIALLPLTEDEFADAGKLPSMLEDFLLCGGYPALYDRELSPGDCFPNYVSTYLGPDVRQLVAVRDLSLFQRDMRMGAARSGQLLDLAALGAACGISAVTARQEHQAIFPGCRAYGLASGHSRRCQHPDTCRPRCADRNLGGERMHQAAFQCWSGS